MDLLKISIAILSGVVVILIFFNIALSVDGSNAVKYSALANLVAAIGTIGAFLVLAYQMYLQTSTFQLEHRPHLYLDDSPSKTNGFPVVVFNEKRGGWFGGTELHFRNVGKDPATITKTEYMVASDARGVVDFRDWFDKEYGGFPDINVVFPGQDVPPVPCHPIIASWDQKPKLLYIGAIVNYTGPTGKKYWYKYGQLFVIESKVTKDKAGNERRAIHPLKPDHDWDNNREDPAPRLQMPNWNEYLSRKYIKKLTE